MKPTHEDLADKCWHYREALELIAEVSDPSTWAFVIADEAIAKADEIYPNQPHGRCDTLFSAAGTTDC